MNGASLAGAAWELPVAAAAGAVVGVLVSRVVRRLLAPHDGRAGAGAWSGVAWAAVGFAAAAAGLWWWEVVARGQMPTAIGPVPRDVLAWRWAGHLAFLGILAAAAWVDLRERVIPDAITMPGVVAGLAWSALRPGTLPPVARAVSRSFAAPLHEADVLGVCGPLGDAGWPAWLGPAPASGGLAVAAALFVVWWWGCTAPVESGPSGRRRIDPRLPVLVAGLVGITAAWWHGGQHWAALLTAIVGMAAGAAMAWTTRIGASWALGREALGFGDVTLMAAIGAWLGWQGALLTCCVGVAVGLAHGLALFVLARDNELPFGPSLCVGAALVMVLWRPLWDRAAPAFERPLEIAAVTAAVVVLTALTLAAWWRLRRGTTA